MMVKQAVVAVVTIGYFDVAVTNYDIDVAVIAFVAFVTIDNVDLAVIPVVNIDNFD